MVLTGRMELQSSDEGVSRERSPRSVGLDAVVCVVAVIVAAVFGWMFYVLSGFMSGGPIDISSVIFFSFIVIINVVRLTAFNLPSRIRCTLRDRLTGTASTHF